MSITNIEYIKSLANILDSNNLTRIDVSNENSKITIERTEKPVLSAQKKYVPDTFEAINNDENEIINFNSLTEIKSPVVGVFYSAPSPEADAFVSIGDFVKKGDVLCIIEAMKLLNEVTAEQDGRIVDICLKNGDVVEYGQVLFKIT